MKTIVSTLLIILTLPLFSQEYSKKFGEVSQAELALKQYAKDPKAPALVLYDKGESRFESSNQGGYDIIFTHSKRIKLFEKNATQYAEIKIPYYVDGYGRTELISEIEAYTYNLADGKVSMKGLSPGSVYEEVINSEWKQKVFTFPDIQDGSVLEYRYKKFTPFISKLPDWIFQARIPTLHSQYRVRMIPFYEYAMIAQGISRFDHQDSRVVGLNRVYPGTDVKFKDYQHTYVMKEVPAFKDESYITSIQDYLLKLDFQLSKVTDITGKSREIKSTWPTVSKDLLSDGNFGKYIKSATKIATKLIDTELNLAGMDDEQKSKAIIEYVKTHFAWDKHYGKYSDSNAKTFFSQKSGNAAAINLFLIGMLRSAGIEADPVILSTRDHGKVRTDYPFLHFFNYVIVLCKGEKPFLADATPPYLAYNRIPPRCYNDQGLVVQTGEPKWIRLSQHVPSLNHTVISMQVDLENETQHCKISQQFTDYFAYIYKQRFNNDPASLSSSLEEQDFEEVHNIELANYDKAQLPYMIGFEADRELEYIGDNLITRPFLSYVPTENPFTQKVRNYPIDFVFAQKHSFQISIGIPEGYSAATLPESYQLDNELVEIDITYTQKDQLVEVVGFYYFKKSVYKAREYTHIKRYMQQIVKRFNEQVIISKT